MTTDPSQSEQQLRSEDEAPPQGERQWSMTASRQSGPQSGWLPFAGTLIMLVGIFNLISGLTALFQPEYFVGTSGDLLVFDFGVWGWAWLALGALQVLVGIGATFGQMWARVTGVVLAGLCAIGHLAFLTAFPLWSVLVIAMSILVIYALLAPRSNAVGV